MYHIKSIFSIPIATTPAADPIITILPPVPAAYAIPCHSGLSIDSPNIPIEAATNGTLSIAAERKPKIARGGQNFGSKVNLQLSGDMMRNLQTRGFTNDSVVIGWSGAEAQKIGWNSEMGRTVTTRSKPVSDGILRFVLKEIDRQIEKNIKKQTSKSINYKIGK